MQACLYGHWKVVQILVLFKANVSEHHLTYFGSNYSKISIYASDLYLEFLDSQERLFSGATAIHFAALKGHTRCIRLLVADYVPSLSEFWNVMHGKSRDEAKKDVFDAVYVEP